MTTFVVSLFLPYTIDFKEPDEQTTQSAVAPPNLEDVGRRASTVSIHAQTEAPQSLFNAQQPLNVTIPKTPAAMQEHEDYFTPTQPTAATHFLRPKDPKSLVRSDAHVPEWGASGLFFNQPRSRVDPAPADILAYAKAQERAQAQRDRSRERAKTLYKSKIGGDPRWKQEYSIVPAIQGNGGLTNAVNAAVDSQALESVIAVGLVGFPTDVLDEKRKTEIAERLEEEHDAVSVFVSDTDYDGHYAHYCKVILWPVFHYVIPDHPKSKAFLDHSWKFYENVNQAFADKVVKNYKRGDIIWIHDYHLCLVPAMIRQKLPDAKIGFFLHAAFPSSEVFRCLAARKQLLEGMLGAALVAFQTHEYAHHFLQTCSRILTVEATEDGVQLENRFVNVWSSPIGVYPRSILAARQEPEVKDWLQTMQERYKDKHVIVARDKLDSIRGVRQKLLAFELFLNKYPQWKEKVVLIQVATSTMDDSELASTVSEIAARIDAVHSTLTHNPLVFLRQDISFPQYLALLSIADVLAITSLREGMNLTVHEFIICQDGELSPKKHGPVILSEFTGSADIFGGEELAVNPWDYQGIAEAFRAALEMKPVEKERRYRKMLEVVTQHTGEFWMRNLSEHLTKVYDEQYRRDTMSIPRLSAHKLLEHYKASDRRLFILDYEGTLSSFGSVKKAVLPPLERVIDVLRDLVADEKNAVYVMSGCTLGDLEMLFKRVPGLGFIAENGCFLREPGADDWVQFPDEEKTSKWKEAIKQILQYYVERVDDSWIEERQCSLVFHYESANQSESDAATRQAGECANHINDASEQQRVKAIPTKDSVIIEPSDYDKATAAQHILSLYPDSARPEFLLVAGNDRDDETVFKWAKDIKEEDNPVIKHIHSVTVGDRNSLALSTLTNGATGLLGVLTKLAKGA